MDGFEVSGEVLRPAVKVSDETHVRLMRVMCAVATGATPEEVTTWLKVGFPEHVREHLGDELVGAEMAAHVDVFLGAMQTAAKVAA